MVLAAGCVRIGAVLFALAAWLPAPANATIVQWLAEQHGVDPRLFEPAPSARLLGIGGLDLVVLDEANEINSHDFGRNVAGTLEDGDGWVVESWIANHRDVFDRKGRSVEDHLGASGFQAVYRKNGSRALGAEVNWDYLETTGHPGDWARVRGPLISGLVNQRVGPLTAGFKLGRETENEDRHSADFFTIAHGQDRWIGRLGLSATLQNWTMEGQWEFRDGDVRGSSVDAARFHKDNYTWTRPENIYTIAVIRPLGGGRHEGGVRARVMDRKGSESVQVSWSDDSPENGSGADYFASAVTFWERESSNDLAAVWRYRPQPGRVVGVEGVYRNWEHEIVEGINFKGSAQGGHWRRKSYEVRGGVSQTFFDTRLLAALEARGGMTEWSVEEELSTQAADGRIFSIGAGLEYFASRSVALRAGYAFGSNDTNVDAPLTMLTGQTASGGFSWLPRGGLIQVHGGLLYSSWKPEDADAAEIAGEDRTGYVLSLRLLL